jgi:hypothetical protein
MQYVTIDLDLSSFQPRMYSRVDLFISISSSSNEVMRYLAFD